MCSGVRGPHFEATRLDHHLAVAHHDGTKRLLALRRAGFGFRDGDRHEALMIGFHYRPPKLKKLGY
jgi:hypothetical protein